jgi:hypothetical protein
VPGSRSGASRSALQAGHDNAGGTLSIQGGGQVEDH